MTDPVPDSQWTFLTNHSHVLLCLVREPGSTLRQVAERVGITERAVQRIVRELEQAGVLTRARQGRRNTYTVNPGFHLRHPLEAHRTVGHLLALLEEAEASLTARPT
ncbi:N-acetylglucosamine deacetylase [Deinococcus aerius]|uniref:N-acetylglucosamine deacetylase n=1 Tax=Deinococcus aerius TaxID=200253 RepID=A0A2I9D0A1_9DEIO|nr:winged helix-turn-helix domain-containing protein [Deinococcus aerius]GBF07932.1 N-acetylglucosamine deacetylase [Deinococcus aerius]